jgi:uncharacterized membrane protein
MAEAAANYLRPNERVIVELDGVVSGYTRWSSAGGLLGILAALTVPRVLSLGFWLGVISIVVVVTAVFLLVYYLVGRRLAARAAPPSETPYVTLVLTDKRMLLLDRGLGAEEPDLIEECSRDTVSTVRHGSAGPLVPQRLGYVIAGTERRELEFPRSQPVARLVEQFS